MKLRYERKYLVPNSLRDVLRSDIEPFVRPDTFAMRDKLYPEYTVRSIYLDSQHRHAVDEKLEGLRDRKKLRVRGYDSETPESIVFLEIKRKISNRIGKNRARIQYADLAKVLCGDDWEGSLLDAGEKAKDDAARFLYNMHRYRMEPVNLVVYDREPYHGKFDSGTRITFDKNIRTALNPEWSDLFKDPHYEYPWKNHFILEIKYYDPPMPTWAKSLVQAYELKAEALSKYVEGILCHDYLR